MGGKECREGGERSDGMRGNAAAFRTTQNIFGRFSKSHYVEDCRRNIDAASKAIVPYRPSRSPRWPISEHSFNLLVHPFWGQKDHSDLEKWVTPSLYPEPKCIKYMYLIHSIRYILFGTMHWLLSTCLSGPATPKLSRTNLVNNAGIRAA